jgi:sphingolipid delta-4 desaturase
MLTSPAPEAQTHSERRLAILRAQPDVARLFGASWLTGLFAVGATALQFLLAYLIRNQPWWAIILLAYGAGGFIIHALNCVIHECTHNLVFQGSPRNKLMGIFSTLASLVPAACGFRHYHLLHHREFGVRGLDADVPPAWEIKLVGHSWYRKLIWLLLLPLGYTIFRPLGIRDRMPIDGWFIGNILLIALMWVLVVHFWGWAAAAYLLLSAYLSVGPHPAGAHILQEHIGFEGGKNHASYYGVINWISVNLGYHLEHHDLPHVAGWRLPQVRKMAPEFYAEHFVHRSRAIGLWRFVFDPRIGLECRIMRDA